jgi:hypothetical protein
MAPSAGALRLTIGLEVWSGATPYGNIVHRSRAPFQVQEHQGLSHLRGKSRGEQQGSDDELFWRPFAQQLKQVVNPLIVKINRGSVVTH